MIHAAVNAGHHGERLPGQQRPDDLHPLLYQKIAVHVRAEKDQILGRIIEHTGIKEPVILIDFSGFQFVGRQNEPVFLSLAQAIDQMGFLGIHTARDLYHACILFTGVFDGMVLFQFPQGRQKCLHCLSPHFIFFRY